MDIAALQAATIARKGLLPPGPQCGATGCTATTNLGQWRRRLTDEEYAQELAIIQQRWDERFALRDIQLPDPVQPDMPPWDSFTRTVIGCSDHAVHADTAARIHAADCPGPDADNAPHCGCEPEEHPEPDPEPEQQAPAHWAAAMARGPG